MRSWVLLLIQIFMPVVFLAIAIVVARQQNNVGNLPAMPLGTSSFDNPITLVETSEDSGSYNETYQNIVGSAYQKVPSIEAEILRLVGLHFHLQSQRIVSFCIHFADFNNTRYSPEEVYRRSFHLKHYDSRSWNLASTDHLLQQRSIPHTCNHFGPHVDHHV